MIIERDDVSSKSSGVAMILAFFFGMIGAQRLYVGRWKSGVFCLIFGSTGFITGVLRALDMLTWKTSVLLLIPAEIIYAIALYDISALYHDAFLDSKGKIVLSNSHKDELFGRTKREKRMDKSDSQVALMLVLLAWIALFIAGKILWSLK